MDALLEKLVRGLRDKKIDCLSAVAVLQEAVRLARGAPDPRAAVEQTLRRLAAGKDGVEGTADDVLPPATVASLVKLLGTGLVGDLVDALASSPLSRLRCWACTS